MSSISAIIRNKPEALTPLQRALRALAACLLVLMVLSLLVGNLYYRARAVKLSLACSANRVQIQSARDQWATDQKQPATAAPTWADLVGRHKYLREPPTCGEGGHYTIGEVGEDAKCSFQHPVVERFR